MFVNFCFMQHVLTEECLLQVNIVRNVKKDSMVIDALKSANAANMKGKISLYYVMK